MARLAVEQQRIYPSPVDVLSIDCLHTLKVYFDPLRARIMQDMAHEPRTVHQVAETLSVPYTRLYYHIKMLEKHKLIRVVDVVQLAGVVEEKYYMVTARQYAIDPKLLTFEPVGKSDSVEHMMDGTFGASQRDFRSSIDSGRIDQKLTPPDSRALLARKCLFRLTDDQAEDFQTDLAKLLSKYQSMESAAENPFYSCLLALYRSSVPDEACDQGGYEDIE